MFEINKLYNQDCITYKKTLPNECIDLIVADPPYYSTKIDEVGDGQWESEEEYLKWSRQYLTECARLLKHNGNLILYCSRQLSNDIQDILDKFLIEQRVIIWARKRDKNNTRGKALSSGYEPILWYSKSDEFTFNQLKIPPDERLMKRPEYREGGRLADGVCLTDVWTDIPALPHNAKEKTSHKTQKPLKLCDRIVNLFSNEDDLVYIPFAGSGSEIESCIINKRNWIATEINDEYFNNIIIPRLNKYNI